MESREGGEGGEGGVGVVVILLESCRLSSSPLPHVFIWFLSWLRGRVTPHFWHLSLGPKTYGGGGGGGGYRAKIGMNPYRLFFCRGR